MAGDLPRDGLVAVVKRDCPTCVMAAPILGVLARHGGLTVYTQDDPSFPEILADRIDDRTLHVSHQLRIEVVPTLIRFEGGREVGRTYGWDRGEWERLSGIAGLGADLPEARPGCGARNVEPGVLERLKVRFNETGLKSRRIEIGSGTSRRRCSRAAGRMGCRWCRRLRSASCACSTARRAIRGRFWDWSRPTWHRQPSKRSGSMR